MRNEEVLHRVKEERNIIHAVKRRKANWIGCILCRNCLLTHITQENIEEGIEVKGKRGKRRKQVLDDLKDTKGYWKLKEKAIDRSMWRTIFGRGNGPVVKQATE